MKRCAFRLLFLLLFITVWNDVAAQAPKWKATEAEGDTLYNQQRYAEASVFYTKVLDGNKLKEGKYEDRNLYQVLYKRAVCYYSTEQFEKALADLELFAPAFPRAPQPKLLKAFIYRELNDTEKQLSNLTEAMALMPPNKDFLKWRGMLLIQKNKYPEAFSDLRSAKQFQDDPDPELETYLAICYYHTDRKDSAYLSFNNAIELDPTHMATYLYAGSMALQDGDYELSLEYTNLALRLDSKSKEALFYKGVSLVEMGRADEGCRCLNRAFYAGFDDAGEYLMQSCFGQDN